MENKCNEYLDVFYGLDKHEHLPLKLSMHLLFCKECRTTVRNLTKAEKLLSEKAMTASDDSSETAANLLNSIAKINLNYHEKKTSLRKWALSGTGLFACFIIMIPLLIIKEQDFLSLISTISLSALLCIWCGLFVGNNMDYFVKMSSRLDSKIHG
ncbi:hypothetical protein [Treponema sp.]|uniref:hypothetical protein n=1 Tax=Treponema sp. TaxID=166 RepID=UPI00388DB6FB